MSSENIKPIISQEVAEAEFNRFVEANDLELNESKMDAEDLTALHGQKDKIIKAMKGGHLVVNEDGEPVYTPYHKRSKIKDSITFGPRTGSSLMAMDRKKKNQDVSKMYAVLAEMCGIDQIVFAGLAGPDIKICEALFALLMA